MADSSIIFDTHRFVKHLTEAGMEPPVAEALADEQVQLLERNLATKADIADLKRDIAAIRKDTQTDIAALQKATQTDIAIFHKETKISIESLRKDTQTSIARLETKIAESKVEIIKWNLGTLLALAALGVAALAAWPQ